MSQQDWDNTVNKHKASLKTSLKPAKVDRIFQILDYPTFKASAEDEIQRYSDSRVTRCLKKIDQALEPAKTLMNAISVFVQANPSIASLVWGSLLSIILLLRRSVSVLEHFSKAFDNLKNDMPLHQRRINMLPQNVQLREHVLRVYDGYVSLLVEILVYVSRNPMRNFIGPILWSGIEKRFANATERIKAFSDRVLAETELSVNEDTVSTHELMRKKMENVHIVPHYVQSNRTVDTPRNDMFFGRSGILQRIHQQIGPDNRVLPARMQSCILSGLGGMGKTQIALEYTYRYVDKYDYTFWVRAEKGPELAEQYGNIAIKAGVGVDRGSADQRQNVRNAKDWLSSTDKDWLLVFDNVNDMKDILQFIPAGLTGSIIITTQRRDLEIGGRLHISVDGFDKGDGAELLLKYVQPRTEDRVLAEKISESVGGMPLAISHIGGFLRWSDQSFDEFLKDFEHRQKSSKIWRSKPGTAVFQYERSLETVFDIALSALTPETRNLIDCIAFLSPEDIWETMFQKTDIHPALSFLCPGTENEYIHLRAVLADRFLVSRDHQESKLSIHRALKHSLLYKLDDDPAYRHKVFTQSFHLVRGITPKQSPLSSQTYQWDAYEKALPHAISLRAAFIEAQSSKSKFQVDLEFAELLSDIGNYMWERFLLKDAFNLLRTAEDICNTLLDPEDSNPVRSQVIYLMASFELNHGSTMRRAGFEHKKRIVELRERRVQSYTNGQVPEVDSLQLSTAYNNLGCAYLQADDYERGAPLLEKSLSIKRQWGNEMTLASGFAEQYKNLSLVALSRGNIQEALRLSKLAVNTISKSAGLDAKITLFHRFMRACVLYNTGSIAEALAESRDVLEKRKAALTEQDDQTLDSYYVVGFLCHMVGNLNEAEVYLDKCIKAGQEEYYDTRVARAIYRRGLVYRNQGKALESEAALQEASKLCDKLVPSDCPGVDLTVSDRAIVFDQMVSIWAGRFTGRINIEWQRKQHGAANCNS